MLNVNTLPNRKEWKIFKFRRRRRRRKTKTSIEKEQKKRKIFFKTNVLVSSQNHRSKKRRGRHCSGVSPTFSSAGSFVFSRQAGRAAFFHGNLQNSGKLPLTTTNVPTTKRRLLDFCLALQNRTNEQKMQLSLTERSDLNIRCNQMTQKQLFHSLFLGCVYTQKIYSIPRGAMLLLVSLWL